MGRVFFPIRFERLWASEAFYGHPGMILDAKAMVQPSHTLGRGPMPARRACLV